uniref:Uncharacterized protein n=1 Tax=Euplotes crassus TaxID=5936 RepID=A0A7S3K7H2_EUPCR|mmetsp:Transcript_13610/g.13540  ORF Transcript_13610/g.13540 Transcript_13610/m.13540 type:complete len:330 (+) Transcript_13610:80-1069(+)
MDDEEKVMAYREKIEKKTKHRIFDVFETILTERKIQLQEEQKALELRKKEQVRHVLSHWIDVGNYWIDKNQPKDLPRTLLKNTPEKILKAEKTPSPDSRFLFTLSKEINKPSPVNKRIEFNSEAKQSKNLDKEKELKSWLFSKVKSIKNKGTPEKQKELSETLDLDRAPSESATNPFQQESSPEPPSSLLNSHKSSPNNIFTSKSAPEDPTQPTQREAQLASHLAEQEALKKTFLEQQRLAELENLKKLKQDRINQLSARAEYLRSQIDLSQKLENDLKILQYQYTMNGDERILMRARQIAGDFKDLHSSLPNIMLELNRINMEISKIQ